MKKLFIGIFLFVSSFTLRHESPSPEEAVGAIFQNCDANGNKFLDDDEVDCAFQIA